jgi:hypothetical protein
LDAESSPNTGIKMLSTIPRTRRIARLVATKRKTRFMANSNE